MALVFPRRGHHTLIIRNLANLHSWKLLQSCDVEVVNDIYKRVDRERKNRQDRKAARKQGSRGGSDAPFGQAQDRPLDLEVAR